MLTGDHRAFKRVFLQFAEDFERVYGIPQQKLTDSMNARADRSVVREELRDSMSDNEIYATLYTQVLGITCCPIQKKNLEAHASWKEHRRCSRSSDVSTNAFR